jgi:hypothetical protein
VGLYFMPKLIGTTISALGGTSSALSNLLLPVDANDPSSAEFLREASLALAGKKCLPGFTVFEGMEAK